MTVMCDLCQNCGRWDSTVCTNICVVRVQKSTAAIWKWHINGNLSLHVPLAVFFNIVSAVMCPLWSGRQ